jgi:hypothetical protein
MDNIQKVGLQLMGVGREVTTRYEPIGFGAAHRMITVEQIIGQLI